MEAGGRGARRGPLAHRGNTPLLLTSTPSWRSYLRGRGRAAMFARGAGGRRVSRQAAGALWLAQFPARRSWGRSEDAAAVLDGVTPGQEAQVEVFPKTTPKTRAGLSAAGRGGSTCTSGPGGRPTRPRRTPHSCRQV